eukprot:6472762-Amphidinium_carterae.1
MVAERTKRNGLGLPTDTEELGITPANYSPLAAGPPRLASTRTSTTTTMSTEDIRGQQQVRYDSWFIHYIQELGV